VTEVVNASGGLVFRRGPAGFEVLMVHRPRYDDWSLPKGKNEPGEDPEDAAVREVEEETGYRCRIVVPAGLVTYPTSLGQTKQVRFFAMRPLRSAGFEAGSEVDDARWVPVATAVELLSYEFDRALVTDADFDALARTGTTYLVRHAAAGDRARWNGDDHARPLSRRGVSQAEQIARLLAPEGIERVFTSSYLRCVQTVEPLAAATGLPIEHHQALVEGADVWEGLELLSSLAGANSVLSSHGDVIPQLIGHLAQRGLEAESPLKAQKASIWALEMEAGAYVRARYIPPPAV
jgi:8-oxo-(d)GTP phosphatase